MPRTSLPGGGSGAPPSTRPRRRRARDPGEALARRLERAAADRATRSRGSAGRRRTRSRARGSPAAGRASRGSRRAARRRAASDRAPRSRSRRGPPRPRRAGFSPRTTIARGEEAHLAAVGAGHEARGNPARREHHRGRRREVLAVARVRAHQEVHERIAAGLGRIERVDEVLARCVSIARYDGGRIRLRRRRRRSAYSRISLRHDRRIDRASSGAARRRGPARGRPRIDTVRRPAAACTHAVRERVRGPALLQPQRLDAVRQEEESLREEIQVDADRRVVRAARRGALGAQGAGPPAPGAASTRRRGTRVKTASRRRTTRLRTPGSAVRRSTTRSLRLAAPKDSRSTRSDASAVETLSSSRNGATAYGPFRRGRP